MNFVMSMDANDAVDAMSSSYRGYMSAVDSGKSHAYCVRCILEKVKRENVELACFESIAEDGALAEAERLDGEGAKTDDLKLAGMTVGA